MNSYNFVTTPNMNSQNLTRRLTAISCLVVFIMGCTVNKNHATQIADNKSVAQTESFTGWYREHNGMGVFQACGNGTILNVNSVELHNKAKAFDLGTDNPIYIRINGESDGKILHVSDVLQFGSDTPIRDCAQNGVIISQ